MLMIEPRTDPRVERLLTRLGVESRFDPDFDLSQMGDPAADTQVRTAIQKSQVAEYATAMAAGAMFPPLVIHHQSLKLIDGNTRWSAAVKARVSRFRCISPKPTHRASTHKSSRARSIR